LAIMPADQFIYAGPVLAPYASRPDDSRGRLHREPDAVERLPHQRDRDRILHSGAFRKLKYKTQVFVYHEGDYYRTRLTHSLEVAQIARSVSRSLGLNEDLAEALALAHDFGHTPFGHAGEDGLDAAMQPYGGFDHNDQSLRIVTRLEQRYADFDGLNLTWETLEGIAKHNGPVHGEPTETVKTLNARVDLGLATYAGAEAQAAAIADDIAYDAHDIDDGLRAGILSFEDLRDIPLVGPVIAEIEGRHGALEEGRMVHEVVRRLINVMVTDLLAETRARLAARRPGSADDVRQAGEPLVGFGETVREDDSALKSFLFSRMYRHYKLNRMASKARRVVTDLFELFMAEPNCLPTQWQVPELLADDRQRARLVADYIAGMTDRYAMLEHKRLFDMDEKT
jgi:dGTPase